MPRTVSDAVLMRAATLVTVHVPQLSDPALLRAAVDSFNRRLKGEARQADLSSDPQFLSRIMVNFLRHAATYDHTRNVFTKAGQATEAGRIVKIRTLEAIAGRYPFLLNECARQAVGAE